MVIYHQNRIYGKKGKGGHNSLFLLSSVLLRTRSGTTCLCTVALCECRMRGREKARGGCSTQRVVRTASHLAAVLRPWITPASLPRAEGVLPRKRYAAKDSPHPPPCIPDSIYLYQSKKIGTIV